MISEMPQPRRGTVSGHLRRGQLDCHTFLKSRAEIWPQRGHAKKPPWDNISKTSLETDCQSANSLTIGRELRWKHVIYFCITNEALQVHSKTGDTPLCTCKQAGEISSCPALLTDSTETSKERDRIRRASDRIQLMINTPTCRFCPFF